MSDNADLVPFPVAVDGYRALVWLPYGSDDTLIEETAKRLYTGHVSLEAEGAKVILPPNMADPFCEQLPDEPPEPTDPGHYWLHPEENRWINSNNCRRPVPFLGSTLTISTTAPGITPIRK